MYRSFGMPVALGLALLGLAGAASAEQRKLIGDITSVDASANSFVAQEKGATPVSFTVDGDSRITIRHSRKTLGLSSLKEGQSVSVSYDEDGGTAVVRHMEVTPSPTVD
jgi:hypothetical protein